MFWITLLAKSPATWFLCTNIIKPAMNEAGQPDPSDLGHPRNEKYSINFTGPGSITVNPQDLDPDPDFAQWKGGINVVQQQSTAHTSRLAVLRIYSLRSDSRISGIWAFSRPTVKAVPNWVQPLLVPISRPRDTKFEGPYTLTSLIPGSGAGVGSGAVPEPAACFWSCWG